MPDDNKALPYLVKHCFLEKRKATLDDRGMDETEAQRAIPGIIEALRRLEAKNKPNARVAAEFGVQPQSVLGWKKTGRIGKGNLRRLAEEAGMTIDQVLNWRGRTAPALHVVSSSQPVSDQRAILAAAMRLVDRIRDLAVEPLSDALLHDVRMEAIDEISRVGIDQVLSGEGLNEAAASVAARIRSR